MIFTPYCYLQINDPTTWILFNVVEQNLHTWGAKKS